ncbi:MAG: NAD(P)-binding domain-containing protein [Spirochaetales bacterium]|nr:NAD(P)-binding domain-containing protein [Spirochaetales bacterium]
MINKRIGIIGYGHMGKMIYEGILSSNLIPLANLLVTTRSKEKLNHLAASGATVCETNTGSGNYRSALGNTNGNSSVNLGEKD